MDNFNPPNIEEYLTVNEESIRQWITYWLPQREDYFYRLVEQCVMEQRYDILAVIVRNGGYNPNWAYEWRTSADVEFIFTNMMSRAVATYNASLMRAIISAYPDINPYYRDIFKHPNIDVVKLIIEKGYLNSQSAKEYFIRTLLPYYISRQEVDIIECFFPVVEFRQLRYDIGFLQFYTRQMSLDNIIEYTPILGQAQENLLIAAVRANSLPMVKLLLKLDFPEHVEYLHDALDRGHFTVAELILNHYPQIQRLDSFKLYTIINRITDGDKPPLSLLRLLFDVYSLEEFKDNYSDAIITIADVYPKAIKVFTEKGIVIDEAYLKYFMENYVFNAEKLKNLFKNSTITEMTITDFLIQNNYIDEDYPYDKITIINEKTLYFAVKQEKYRLFHDILTNYQVDINDPKLLIAACKNQNDIRFVEDLLQCDINIEFVDEVLRNQLTEAILFADASVLEMFLRRNFQLPSKISLNSKLISLLEFVVRNCSDEHLRLLIEMRKINTNIEIDDLHDPIILLAAQLNQFDHIKLMLPNTLYLNRLDSKNQCLLGYVIAADGDHRDILLMLIQMGVDLKVKLTYHLMVSYLVYKYPPLFLAIIKNKKDYLRPLVEAGCDINELVEIDVIGDDDVYNFHNSAISVANTDDLSLVREIFELGFNVIWNGVTAAAYFTDNDAEDACLLAIEYLPEQVDIQLVGGPLIMWSETSAKITKALIKAGVDVNVLYDGKNALDIELEKSGDIEKILIFLEVGLRPTIGFNTDEPLIAEALVFWGLSKEERQKVPLNTVARLCPLRREKIYLVQMRSFLPVVRQLPNELVGEILSNL